MSELLKRSQKSEVIPFLINNEPMVVGAGLSENLVITGMRRLQNPPSPTNMVSIVSKNGIRSQKCVLEAGI
jgi:hypothetical protein